MVTFSGYKINKFFGTIEYHISKAGTFHQEVLRQRTDSGNDFLHRSRFAVFFVHPFCGIFSLAQANGKNRFILDFHSCGNFPLVPIYFVSNFQIIQTQKRD